MSDLDVEHTELYVSSKVQTSLRAASILNDRGDFGIPLRPDWDKISLQNSKVLLSEHSVIPQTHWTSRV